MFLLIGESQTVRGSEERALTRCSFLACVILLENSIRLMADMLSCTENMDKLNEWVTNQTEVGGLWLISIIRYNVTHLSHACTCVVLKGFAIHCKNHQIP